MRITIVIASLSAGGAERVVTLHAKGLADRGHKVTVITLYGKELDFYSLPQGVCRLALDIMGDSKNIIHALRSNFYRLARLRQAIKSTNPDIVISHLTPTNVLTILSLAQSGIPVIVSEHSEPKMFSYGKPWSILRRILYPYAANLVSVSQGVDEGFNWLSLEKKTVIYNPFVVPNNQNDLTDLPSSVDMNKHWIVSMGRLTHQKGFDILLSAFAKIASHHPDWQLLILGKGELRESLEKMIEDLGLSGRVILTGVIKNPSAVLRKAKLFVMSSRHEAFPMAHGEAMACGCPIIATDCQSGPREIIRHGIDGILVPNGDITALAAAMNKLMSSEKERQILAIRSPEVTERFSMEKIVNNWEYILQKVTGQKYQSLSKTVTN